MSEDKNLIPADSGFDENEKEDQKPAEQENKSAAAKIFSALVEVVCLLFKAVWQLIVSLFKVCRKLGTFGMILFVIIMAAALYGVSYLFIPGFPGIKEFFAEKTETVVAPVTLIRIEKLQKLDLLKVYIGDFIKQDYETEIDAFLKKRKPVTLMSLTMVKGYVKISIDFEKVQQKVLDPVNKVVEVSVPLPQADLVNLQELKYVDNEGRNRYSDEFFEDNAAVIGRKLLEEKANSQAYILLAKDHAINIIKGMYQPLGWHVKFVWQEPEEDKTGEQEQPKP